VAKEILTVAWISDFPIEWLADVPAALRHLPRRHPATWAMVLLAEFQKNPAVRVHVILFRGRIERDLTFEQNGVTFHVLKANPKLRLASFFWLDTLKIRRTCRQIQPDIVHAWGSEKGAPLIAHRLRYPYVMTIQGLFAWYKEQIELPRYDHFVEFIERLSLRHAPVVTTESNFAVKFLRERYPAMKIHQAEHAPNQAFHQIQRRPQTNPLRFIAVGGIGHRKGTDLILAALEQLRPELDFTMTFITNPNTNYVAGLQQQVSAAAWQRIEFKYHLLPHEVAKELETATLLLMPTRADTSPNAVKEAVVAGVPVVAAEIGGIPDYVRSGRNGLLFPVGELPAFVEALRTACQHPLFSRGAVESDTLRQEREYLSPALMAKKFLAAYEAAVMAGR
jgi:glycosyltransferase involved in cell wall biosynthesis